jgi:nuclear transport factor 2 (NTF2) superfamily protein
VKSTAETSTKRKRPTPLRESEVKKFLAKYKKAWETRDADLAASLFTRDAHYRQGPFTAPITGREAIHDYWAGATGRQEDIHFNVDAFVHSGYLVAVEWTCAYKDRSTGDRKELAGMFLADFYGEQLRAFREYWHSRSR